MLQESPPLNSNNPLIGTKYDPLVGDVYTLHLARVNERRPVIASENICDTQGRLLLQKGAPVTGATAQEIIDTKLLLPIEHSIVIDNEIDGNQLEKDFIAVMRGDDILHSIHDRYSLDTLLHQQCSSYQSYPLLRQKITVLAERMPETYNRSLYCAWLAMLIAKEMRLPRQEINAVFLGALCHDIGMLHVNPQVLGKSDALTAEEWRELQTHVVIGQKILACIDGLPSQVSLAVLEHHERCDGTGYPSGKVESELSLLGQIIALADSVIAVYHNRFKPHGRSWRDVIPVIQMNNQAYFYRNFEILTTILRRSEMPQPGVVGGDGMPDFIEKFIQQQGDMKARFKRFEKLLLSFGYTHGDRKLHALQNVFLHIATSINGSGIFQNNYGEWLEQVKSKCLSQAYSEVEDAYLMLEEVSFHLQRLNRMIQIYASSGSCKDKAIQEALEAELEKESQDDRVDAPIRNIHTRLDDEETLITE